MTASLSRRSAALLTLGAAAGLMTRIAPARAVLRAPAQPVILTVSGMINVTNSDHSAVFDLPMLEAMPQHSFTTKTPWYSGPETFEGVLMRDLMREVGATGSKLLAIALNDYSSELPLGDFTRYDVILAIKRDGAYMPIRDKGPLFIVYPYDTDSDLRAQKFYSRSAWQVAQLIVS